MAFDQTTRNRLQRFVNDARRVLEEEFTRQLQNDYGMDPNAGTVAELASLRHINDAQRETARILRDTLAHYTAGSDMNASQGLDRIVREQAFTVLNRLAALRMAESRGLLVESVGNGFQAKGFQLYARLAGTGLGETGDAYRVYLFSVFDELAQDLPGLFDRYSPQGRLFPREAALLQVLNLINDADIATLWSEDETIGWIYQYFNSKEERKAMRDASQAPRNSRELAVRNQFFTPRYVVEFLVDNTLGRLWFNATGGTTGLRERCQYLLVKPDETPQAATKLRDPRTLKLLDPACGSMHFGLCAFDLFADIYREAWAWEQQHGPGSLDVSTQPQAALRPLSQTYDDEAAFLRDVPRLIIEHNIYGVDIDPRASQIASLALWLRAQRAWHDEGVKAKERPLIGRGHVVAAIAPPAERELRQQFAANLDQRDAELFEKTLQLLKGLPELGVLLQVERELPHLIRQVYVGKGTGLFAEQEQESWQQAEARLRTALTEFAQAAKSTYQGRLFAQDALQGLQLIDLCREVFDVVVMNPPFGESSNETSALIRSRYPDSSQDLALTFVERAIQLAPHGLIGALTTRTGFYLTGCTDWRRGTLDMLRRLQLVADLGYGVLDAVVETAAYIVNPKKLDPDIIVISALESIEKECFLKCALANHNYFSGNADRFADLPNTTLAYWAPDETLTIFNSTKKLEPTYASVRRGVATGDNFRLLRLFWEIKRDQIGKEKEWIWYAKGGEYSPYFAPSQLVLRWVGGGSEIRNFFDETGRLRSRPQNLEYFGSFGLAYSSRTTSGFGPRLLPLDHGFDQTSNPIIPANPSDSWWLLPLLMTRPVQAFIELSVGGGDTSQAGTAARDYTNGLVGRVPVPDPGAENRTRLSEIGLEITSLLRTVTADNECTPEFLSPRLLREEPLDLRAGAQALRKADLENYLRILELSAQADELAIQVFNLDPVSIEFLDKFIGKHPWTYSMDGTNSRVVGPARLETKKCFWANQELEVLAHQNQLHPRKILSDHSLSTELTRSTPVNECKKLVSYFVGCAFGRWTFANFKNTETFSRDLPSSLLPESPGSPEFLNGGMMQDRSALAPMHEVLTAGEGIQKDLISLLHLAMEKVWSSQTDQVLEQLENIIGSPLPEYISKTAGFFTDHLQTYTAHSRRAPIYWPLTTTSGSYTLWVYYPSLTSQTLYTAINDFVEPKLKQVGGDVTVLRNKGSARTRDDEKQFEALQAFELELIELRDTLLTLAPTYKPNHDDGVQISAAPLWPLFRHKPWQKVLKDTWAKLERGDYDWAHLAMNYWPERVREKCKSDKSLAIAHDLEDMYIQPESAPKRVRKKKAGSEE